MSRQPHPRPSLNHDLRQHVLDWLLSMGFKIEALDLFCGAGGVTEGFSQSEVEGYNVVDVTGCVNHDPLAIKSHAANHPDCRHFTEDIRKVPLMDLPRKSKPSNIYLLWASLECTEFSKAKNGAKNADSRTLAADLFRYVDYLEPDYIGIENVEEFMGWGELDHRGVPVKRKAGILYQRWVESMEARGYRYAFRILNSADYGAYTKRKRYFALFAKGDLPLVFPEPTHAEKPQAGNFGKLKKWKAMKDVLDLGDYGKSIFDRKDKRGNPDPLADNTIIRLHKGLKKFLPEQRRQVLMTCNTPGYCSSLENPAGALTQKGHKALVTPFLMQFNGTSGCHSLNLPCNTIVSKDRFALLRPVMIQGYFGNPETNPRISSVNEPAPTIPAQVRRTLVFWQEIQQWLYRQFSNGGEAQSISAPAGALLKTPKVNLCSAFLVNPQFGNKGNSIAEPAPTLVKIHGKKPMQLCSAWLHDGQFDNAGSSLSQPAPTLVKARKYFNLATAFAQPLDPASADVLQEVRNHFKTRNKAGDSQAMRELKKFCRLNGVADVRMRMLKVPELKKIQGFPEDYHLAGSQEKQKAFIGQSVTPAVPKAWGEALATAIFEHIQNGGKITNEPLLPGPQWQLRTETTEDGKTVQNIEIHYPCGKVLRYANGSEVSGQQMDVSVRVWAKEEVKQAAFFSETELKNMEK